jgi:hypothetical protein
LFGHLVYGSQQRRFEFVISGAYAAAYLLHHLGDLLGDVPVSVEIRSAGIAD